MDARVIVLRDVNGAAVKTLDVSDLDNSNAAISASGTRPSGPSSPRGASGLVSLANDYPWFFLVRAGERGQIAAESFARVLY
jgi:hypothetical protein